MHSPLLNTNNGHLIEKPLASSTSLNVKDICISVTYFSVMVLNNFI